MWLANFENGNSITSKNTFWTQLRERANGAKMTGLQLSSLLFPSLTLCLSDLDRYYFVTEAVAMMGGEGFHGLNIAKDKDKYTVKSDVVAEIIGGHNLDLGVGLEIRLEYTGSAKSRIYRLERYKYSQDILVEGTRKH